MAKIEALARRVRNGELRWANCMCHLQIVITTGCVNDPIRLLKIQQASLIFIRFLPTRPRNWIYWRASYFVKTGSIILLRHLRQTSVAQRRRGLQQCSETYSGRPFTQRVMPVFITSPPKLSQYPSLFPVRRR
jgi:hypothetical protein